MRYDGTDEHGADGVLDHAIGRDEARRVEHAEPVADLQRQRGTESAPSICAWPPYASCAGPPVVSNVVCSSDEPAAERRRDRVPRARRACLDSRSRPGGTAACRSCAGCSAPRSRPAVVRPAQQRGHAERERVVVVVRTSTRRRRSAPRPRTRSAAHPPRRACRASCGIEAQRDTERTARRQAGRLAALGRRTPRLSIG